MQTIIDKLTSLGFNPQKPLLVRKEISVEEKGKRYQLKMVPERSCAAYQVDGYIIKEGNKCDKLVLVETAVNSWTEIFVELKGRNIEHAIKQLEETVKNQLFKHSTIVDRRARIVGQSIPRCSGNSVMERARIRFFSTYKCDLKAMSQVYKENI